MRKYLFIAIAIIALLGSVSYLLSQNRSLRADNERQSGNVSTLMDSVRHYKVAVRHGDSVSLVNAASVSALNLTIDEFKRYRADDAKLIEELNLRIKDVEYLAKTEIKTKDSLVFKIDTVGCFHYLDKWLRVDACIGDSSMVIESRDSIAQVVHAIYKHRFLWWRWKVIGFRQEVVNFNPKSEIGYSEIVRIQK